MRPPDWHSADLFCPDLALLSSTFPIPGRKVTAAPVAFHPHLALPFHTPFSRLPCSNFVIIPDVSRTLCVYIYISLYTRYTHTCIHAGHRCIQPRVRLSHNSLSPTSTFPRYPKAHGVIFHFRNNASKVCNIYAIESLEWSRVSVTVTMNSDWEERDGVVAKNIFRYARHISAESIFCFISLLVSFDNKQNDAFIY